MINYLSGKIIDKHKRHITLDVNSVGYKIFMTENDLSSLELQSSLSLFIYTSVREDDISLYGFKTKEALNFFELLISVNRVGPKIALEIMDAPLPKIKQAIVKKDLGFLSRIPGIGRKTAERIILELHDKVSLEPGAESSDKENLTEIPNDIIEALIKLGYQRQHVSRVLSSMPKEIKNDEAVIKYFLQHV